MKMISGLSIYVDLFGVGNIYMLFSKLFILETITVSFGDQGLLSCLAIFIIIQFELFCYIYRNSIREIRLSFYCNIL